MEAEQKTASKTRKPVITFVTQAFCILIDGLPAFFCFAFASSGEVAET